MNPSGPRGAGRPSSRAGRGTRRSSGRPPRSPGAGCPRRSACGRRPPRLRARGRVGPECTSAPLTSMAIRGGPISGGEAASEEPGELAGDPRVVDDERRVGAQRRAVGQDRDPREEPRRQVGPGDRWLRWLPRSRARRPRGRRRRAGRPRPGPGRRRGSRHRAREPGASRRSPRRPRRRAPMTARRSPPSGHRTPAGRPGRPRRPGRRGSRDTRASPGHRGSPSARRTRPPSASGRAPRDPTRCRMSDGRRLALAHRPSSAPRWTPPIPPVAKTRMPAAWAAIIVAETVVAAQPPSASAAARLGRAALRTEPAGAVASALSAASSRPTSSRPAWIATVAGTAPVSRTAASEAVATSRFCGYGSPWLMSVDSSATTGRPAASAAATSGRDVEPVGDHAGASALSPAAAPATRASTAGEPPPGVPATGCPLERRRQGPAGRAGREPADEEPGIERVARAGRVGRDAVFRGDLEPEAFATRAA